MLIVNVADKGIIVKQTTTDVDTSIIINSITVFSKHKSVNIVWEDVDFFYFPHSPSWVVKKHQHL